MGIFFNKSYEFLEKLRLQKYIETRSKSLHGYLLGSLNFEKAKVNTKIFPNPIYLTTSIILTILHEID